MFSPLSRTFNIWYGWLLLALLIRRDHLGLMAFNVFKSKLNWKKSSFYLKTNSIVKLIGSPTPENLIFMSYNCSSTNSLFFWIILSRTFTFVKAINQKRDMLFFCPFPLALFPFPPKLLSEHLLLTDIHLPQFLSCIHNFSSLIKQRFVEGSLPFFKIWFYNL